MRLRRSLLFTAVCALTIAFAGSANAQQGPEGGEGLGGYGQFGGMQRVSGVVTAVSPDRLTIKSEDGTAYQVTTTSNTRFMRNGGTFKVTDLKPGDGVMSAGKLDEPNKTLHAAMVISIPAEQVKKLAAAREQFMEKIGKTLIIGRVTAIDLDNAKMTIERPDHVAQTIGFDESTSFRRAAPGRMVTGEANSMGVAGANSGSEGMVVVQPNMSGLTDAGESITLADIKVGDTISGPGSVKNGIFVPAQVVVRTPRAAGSRRREGQGSTPAPSGPAAQ